MRALYLSLPLLAVTLVAQSADPDKGAAAVCTPETIQKNCEDLHNYYSKRFVTSVGFGYDRMPAVEEAIVDKQWQIGNDNYVVKNIQLISILKHDPAAVYPPVTNLVEFDHPPVLAGVTRRGDVAKATADPSALRALDEFETAALKQLKEKNEAMVVSNGTVMVGALRAEASCIQCHDVEKGTLLGAFTYTLEKRPALGAVDNTQAGKGTR
ncbi:MAG TPA: hypothetical protein VG733_02670 [Chthoniobacteraceae bacterium]|nr:hypothetical protein [Chthoniobacteraceae bacterium]